ncbi:hypothetical protein H9650_04745 [Psychrobacillus sp. Sa2BUA9]|uniref:Uncharacterized protein n=1 Tax=Psychrobacillus faecigallinarum TaxID=2762235 RepID=A0ABR8R6J6_9BACI|nr:hypothetical protein [Psychrobacillus faecigallinarum]MBD7943418.1 hypothetical protein [Psychrobacillus faecigallinarum]
MEGIFSLIILFIGFYILYIVIHSAVTKGINNSIVGKLLEGENRSADINEILAKYGKIDESQKN